MLLNLHVQERTRETIIMCVWWVWLLHVGSITYQCRKWNWKAKFKSILLHPFCTNDPGKGTNPSFSSYGLISKASQTVLPQVVANIIEYKLCLSGGGLCLNRHPHFSPHYKKKKVTSMSTSLKRSKRTTKEYMPPNKNEICIAFHGTSTQTSRH